VRQKDELETAIAELEELKVKAQTMKAPGASQYNPGWHEALSMKSLLVTSEAVTRAALMREESRGAHTRLDHPGESAEWVKFNVIVKKGGDGKMEVEKRPKPEGAPLLVAIRECEDRRSRVRQGRRGRYLGATAMANDYSRSGGANAEGGDFKDFQVDVDPGMVVLDVLQSDPGAAGQ